MCICIFVPMSNKLREFLHVSFIISGDTGFVALLGCFVVLFWSFNCYSVTTRLTNQHIVIYGRKDLCACVCSVANVIIQASTQMSVDGVTVTVLQITAI